MFRLTHFRACKTGCTLWINKLSCIYQFTASVTLITLCIWEVAKWTFTFNKSVSKKSTALYAELLIDYFFKRLSSLIDVIKYILSDNCLFWGCRSTEVIEITIKPIVYLFMNSIVVVTNFLTSFTFLLGLSFCRSAILVSTTNIDCIMTS